VEGADYTFEQREPSRGSGANQAWDVQAGGRTVARADVYFGESQWGVRLVDQLPALDASELLRIVAHLLVWECGCRADTVDVVLARSGDHYPLIRTGPDYV
jgi:hypothetical protein